MASECIHNLALRLSGGAVGCSHVTSATKQKATSRIISEFHIRHESFSPTKAGSATGCTQLSKQAVRVATQYASAPCKLTISSHLFARWHLFRHVGYLIHQQQVGLWPFDLESGIRLRCDVVYANFSLPRPLCSWVRSDVRDRQIDVRQKHRLIPPPIWGGGITMQYSW